MIGNFLHGMRWLYRAWVLREPAWITDRSWRPGLILAWPRLVFQLAMVVLAVTMVSFLSPLLPMWPVAAGLVVFAALLWASTVAGAHALLLQREAPAPP